MNSKAEMPQTHDEYARLLVRYRPLVDSMAEKYAALAEMSDADLEDLRQEGNIALYNAMVSYDHSQNEVTFGLYAKVCIRNRMISVLRKHKKEDEVSFDDTNWDSDPEKQLIDWENYRIVMGAVDNCLTDYERSVFRLYLQNKKYSEIASELQVNEKSVANALVRIKKKLKGKL